MTGDILFLPPELDTDTAEDQLAFRMKIRELHPRLSWYSLPLKSIATMCNYLRYRLIEQVEKSLVVRVPTAKIGQADVGAALGCGKPDAMRSTHLLDQFCANR